MITTTSAVSAHTVNAKPKRETCSHVALGQRCARRPHKGTDHAFPVRVSVMLTHRPAVKS